MIKNAQQTLSILTQYSFYCPLHSPSYEQKQIPKCYCNHLFITNQPNIEQQLQSDIQFAWEKITQLEFQLRLLGQTSKKQRV